MDNEIWASVLLVDNKIKFWKISANKKSRIEDFYKDFFYAHENLLDYMKNPTCQVETKLFLVNEENTSNKIFAKLAPNWIRTWEMIDNYKGLLPYDRY